jgi:hypothetical protein
MYDASGPATNATNAATSSTFVAVKRRRSPLAPALGLVLLLLLLLLLN